MKAEKPFKLAHGIKLYPRTCSECKLMEFWVPKDSKQQTCGAYCENERRKKLKLPGVKVPM